MLSNPQTYCEEIYCFIHSYFHKKELDFLSGSYHLWYFYAFQGNSDQQHQEHLQRNHWEQQLIMQHLQDDVSKQRVTTSVGNHSKINK
uniref:Uncharacterized protein n=1 Tax=Aegilops tauschii subsp. strangulata TaxID=200361 RepID=A0A453BIC7_AEGTS